MVYHYATQIQKQKHITTLTKAQAETYQRAVVHYNRLNQLYKDGKITIEQYEKGVNALNMTTTALGQIPFIVPKHIRELIEAKNKTKDLTKEANDLGSALGNMRAEMMGLPEAFGLPSLMQILAKVKEVGQEAKRTVGFSGAGSLNYGRGDNYRAEGRAMGPVRMTGELVIPGVGAGILNGVLNGYGYNP